MVSRSPALSIVLNHPDAARLIEERSAGTRDRGAGRRAATAIHRGGGRVAVELLDQAKKLRWFQCTGAGVDSMLPIRDRMGHITVTNARGIHGDIIADFVMARVTMLHWDFRRLLSEQSERKWNPRYVAPLADKTLGVVGLG